jgi:hypothetical protein
MLWGLGVCYLQSIMHGDKKHLERITGLKDSVQDETEQVSVVLRCSVSEDEGSISMPIGDYSCAHLRHKMHET